MWVRDIFSLLKEKTARLFEKHQPLKQSGQVFAADAKRLTTTPAMLPFLGQVNLIVSSPPYLGIVNYAKQNWIRSWLLNKAIEENFQSLDDNLNLHEWIAFAKKVVVEIKKMLKPDGVAVLVIGDVAKSKTSIIPLAREFCLLVREVRLFKNVWCISDTIEDTDKTTRIWGETKGSATATDRLVILSDINPFKASDPLINLPPLDYEYVVQSTERFLGQ